MVALQTFLLLPVMCLLCRKERQWVETPWCWLASRHNHYNVVAFKVPSLLWPSMFCRSLFSSHFRYSFLCLCDWKWLIFPINISVMWLEGNFLLFLLSFSSPPCGTFLKVLKDSEIGDCRHIVLQSSLQYTYLASIFLQPISHV